MKKALTTLYAVLAFVLLSFAQPPQAFKYQAAIRDLNGDPMVNETITLRIGILSLNNNSVYSETHVATTNQFGLVDLVIGNGSVVSGSFGSIVWSADLYLLKVEYDQGSGNFITMGTAPLLSVPYAMYDAHSGDPGPEGPPGNGIINVLDNNNGTFTFQFSDGSSFTTSDLTGPQGASGPDGTGIATATITANDELIFALTNGQEYYIAQDYKSRVAGSGI